MKRILSILIVFLTFNTAVSAQESKESGIYFGAIFGTKINTFDRHFIADINPELYSFSIGAGSAWTRSNYVIGFEFLYSSANKNNDSGEIQYIGFSNTLSFGYNISRSQSWKIEPNLGVVLNNHQLVIQDTESGSFQNLTNNQIAANIGLNFKLVDQKGLFTGIKVGYLLPFSGDTEWENKVSGTPSGLKDNTGSFYIQLNVGGLLSLARN
jgi:hypothetical protein